MNKNTPLPKPMRASPHQPKAIQRYLETMNKANPIEQNQIYWWTRMDERRLMQVMQKFCWDNSIDFATVNWGKFLRGENIPGYWENQPE